VNPVTLSGVVERVLQAQPMFSAEVRRRLRDLGFPMGRTDLTRLVNGPKSMIKVNEDGKMELRKSTDRLVAMGKQKEEQKAAALPCRKRVKERDKERRRKKKKDVFDDCDDGSGVVADQKSEQKSESPISTNRIDPIYEREDDGRVLDSGPGEGDVFFPDFEEYGEEEEMPRYIVSLPDEFLKGIGL